MAAPALYSFSDFAGNALYSDAIVALKYLPSSGLSSPPLKRQRLDSEVTAPSDQGNGSNENQQQGVEAELPGHAVILAGASPVFAAQLQWWQENGHETTSVNAGMKRRITITVSNELELEGARALIGFIYQARLPGDASEQLLLATLQLADRYEVQACGVACCDALSAINLAWETVQQLLLLPESFHKQQLFSQLVGKARDSLQQHLGDLEAAWASDSGKERFLALPLKGMELLLGDARTRVCYENTALVATSTWVAQHAEQLTLADHKCLAGLLRLPHLTPYFAAGVAASTEWLVAAIKPATVALAVAVGSAMAERSGPLASDVATSHNWPACWALPRRPVSKLRALKAEVTVTLEQLQAAFGGAGVQLPAGSFAGWSWSLELQWGPVASTGQAAGPQQRRLRVKVLAMLPDSLHLGPQLLALWDVQVKALVPAGGHQSAVNRAYYYAGPFCFNSTTGSQGLGDFLSMGAQAEFPRSLLEPWADKEGRITLQLSINKLQ